MKYGWMMDGWMLLLLWLYLTWNDCPVLNSGFMFSLAIDYLAPLPSLAFALEISWGDLKPIFFIHCCSWLGVTSIGLLNMKLTSAFLLLPFTFSFSHLHINNQSFMWHLMFCKCYESLYSTNWKGYSERSLFGILYLISQHYPCISPWWFAYLGPAPGALPSKLLLMCGVKKAGARGFLLC